ncbi:hypothetical protein CDAR_603141 [Caerostris darwini]|uniref:Uncharacterized protein n=1 Tax=Caerostris darwini TaxID=1538125 RepID=A0AAV4W8H1_9ARAC|nr:hypothetical protein CDAR_603141 [Caerostris darwini]
MGQCFTLKRLMPRWERALRLLLVTLPMAAHRNPLQMKKTGEPFRQFSRAGLYPESLLLLSAETAAWEWMEETSLSRVDQEAVVA